MLVYIKPLSMFPKLHSDTLFGALTSAIGELFPNKVEEIKASFTPTMTYEEYINYLNKR